MPSSKILTYHNLSSSLSFRLKVNIQSATQRQAALFGVNVWPRPVKKKNVTPSTGETVQGAALMGSQYHEEANVFISLGPWGHRLKFLIWVADTNCLITPVSNLEMSVRVQIPLVLFSSTPPFVRSATFQMKSKYPQRRAMNSRQLGATPTEKALWKSGLSLVPAAGPQSNFLTHTWVSQHGPRGSAVLLRCNFLL